MHDIRFPEILRKMIAVQRKGGALHTVDDLYLAIIGLPYFWSTAEEMHITA